MFEMNNICRLLSRVTINNIYKSGIPTSRWMSTNYISTMNISSYSFSGIQYNQNFLRPYQNMAIGNRSMAKMDQKQANSKGYVSSWRLKFAHMYPKRTTPLFSNVPQKKPWYEKMDPIEKLYHKGPAVRKTKKCVFGAPEGQNKPQCRGVVLRTLSRKPRKPNSGNRKCVYVRLTTGKEMIAFVPNEGHNLQEHNVVLCRPGKLKDTPGVLIRCIRGKHDLGRVVKKTL